MIFMLKKNLFLSIMALLMTFFCGCKIEDIERALGLDTPKEAVFVLSFHREVRYPRGNLQAEQPLRLSDGRSFIVERYPMMSSHNILEISAKPVPGKPGFYRLFLRPDQKGRMMWMQMTAQNQQDRIVILLDGLYFGELRTPTVTTGTEKWVELPLDVDAARALQMVKFANDNYRYFNGGDREDPNDIFSEHNLTD